MEKGGTFLAILVVNAVLLILLGSTVIIHAIIQRQEDQMIFAKIPPPPPPPVKPPAQVGGKGAKSNTDPTPVVTPPQASITSVVTTTATTTISFQSLQAPVMTAVSLPSLTDMADPSLSPNHSADHGTVNIGNALFGVPDSNGTPMMSGYLYDLKQTPDRKPTNFTTKDYHAELRNFVAKNWDQTILDKYYKFSTPLFTPEIFIPNISANLGPKQFGADKEVQPRMWVAYYKVTVLPPEDGEFQFYGSCDDILIVRVDGKTVLDGSLTTVSGLKETGSPFDLLDVVPPGRICGSLKHGIPFRVTSGVPCNIEVMIGEEPGGFFNSCLLLGKTSVKYPTGPNGMPKIPIFQVAACDVPTTGMRLDAGPPVVWPAQAAQ